MSEQYSKFSGVFIPREVLLDSDLTASAKLIFAIIQSLDNDKGCFASNEYIGNMLGLSESSVRSSIAELERKHYVTRFVDGECNRTIKTCTTVSLTAGDPRQISGDTPPENKRPPRQKTGTYSNRKNSNRDIKALMLPALPHGADFASAWADWMEYRKQANKPLTPSTILAQLNLLTTLTETDATTSIRNSIQNGWSGLFAPRQQYGKPSNSKPLSQADHNAF
jgi:hypothetical protein